MNEKYSQALDQLRKADPVMGRIIDEVGPVKFAPGGDLFEALVTSIISQVISSAAADTVARRLRAHTQDLITPELLAQIDQETYRSFGIGAQKFRYISGLAREFIARPEHFHDLHTFEDEDVLKRLTALPGIGKWTGQMVLIFCLGRMDVFAPDDLGLRNAMLRYYEWPKDPSRKDLEAKAADWAPYRSLASVYLWNSIKKWA